MLPFALIGEDVEESVPKSIFAVLETSHPLFAVA